MQNVSSQDSISIVDHFFHEIKIGNQWVRVDNMVQLSHKQTLLFDMNSDTPIYVKILECEDVTDYNFHKYWNENTWNKKRGYQYKSVVEQEPKHTF